MADLFLSGFVGDEITGQVVKDFLMSTDDPDITVYINSPGGIVYEGMEVYNLLRASGRHIKTVITGLAASMGSIIFLAGDERIAMSGTFYMVHNPSGFVWDNANAMKKEAALLEKIQSEMASIYKERTHISDIEEYMNQESWFNASEMSELGIVNSEEIPQLENIFAQSNKKGEEMAITEEMKAKMAKLEAENAALKEQQEEAEFNERMAALEASNAQMRAEATEPEPETPEEPESTSTNSDDDSEPQDNPTDPEPEDNSDEDNDPEPTEPAAKAKVIDTRKAVASNKKQNKIPAFMQTESKY
jgi:Protease subunit of ATP-dependent Clp proteases